MARRRRRRRPRRPQARASPTPVGSSSPGVVRRMATIGAVTPGRTAVGAVGEHRPDAGLERVRPRRRRRAARPASRRPRLAPPAPGRRPRSPGPTTGDRARYAVIDRMTSGGSSSAAQELVDVLAGRLPDVGQPAVDEDEAAQQAEPSRAAAAAATIAPNPCPTRTTDPPSSAPDPSATATTSPASSSRS